MHEESEALGATFALKGIEKGAPIEVATRAAIAEGVKTIVAAGGDGTIGALASSLQGSDMVMGIPPLGTFIYFAHSLDLPMEIEAAQKVTVGAETRRGCVKTPISGLSEERLPVK